MSLSTYLKLFLCQKVPCTICPFHLNNGLFATPSFEQATYIAGLLKTCWLRFSVHVVAQRETNSRFYFSTFMAYKLYLSLRLTDKNFTICLPLQLDILHFMEASSMLFCICPYVYEVSLEGRQTQKKMT